MEARTRAAREHRYIPREVVARAALGAGRTWQSSAIRALMSTTPDHWELNALLKVSTDVQLSRAARAALADLGRQVMENYARGILLVRYDSVDVSALKSVTGPTSISFSARLIHWEETLGRTRRRGFCAGRARRKAARREPG